MPCLSNIRSRAENHRCLAPAAARLPMAVGLCTALEHCETEPAEEGACARTSNRS